MVKHRARILGPLMPCCIQAFCSCSQRSLSMWSRLDYMPVSRTRNILALRPLWGHPVLAPVLCPCVELYSPIF